VIVTYGGAATRDIHYADDTKAARAIPKDIWPVARRKLNQLHSALQLKDLASPGNRLEKMKGNLASFHSIRVNDQWRIVFQFERGHASAVQVVDYH
jgi:toxin HigB-1